MAAMRWLSWYQRCLRDYPVRTNIVSGATVMLCGDGVAQGIELGRRKSAHNNETTLDPNRSALLPAMVAESRKYLRGYDLCRSGVMVSWSAVGDVPLNIILFSAIHRVLQPLGIPAVAAFPQSFFKGILFFVPGAHNPANILFFHPSIYANTM